MKKLFLTLLALSAGALTGFAALTALHIHTSSHGIITLLLEKEPSLIFNDDRTITVEVPSDPGYEPVNISFDDVESCEYGNSNDYVEDSAEEIKDVVQSIVMTFGPDGVSFANIPDGNKVEVYTLSGTMLLNVASEQGGYTLARNSFQPGIYIVRIGRFATKISF